MCSVTGKLYTRICQRGLKRKWGREDVLFQIESAFMHKLIIKVIEVLTFLWRQKYFLHGIITVQLKE